MTPRGALGLCCLYIAQLMTHTAIYTLPCTLQLCYKPLDMLQSVTKSQRVHTSIHDRLYTKTKTYFFYICLYAINLLLLIIKKSREIGSVRSSWFSLNFISNELLLILKSRKKLVL